MYEFLNRNAGAKNEWSYTSAAFYMLSWHVMYSFTFVFGYNRCLNSPYRMHEFLNGSARAEYELICTSAPLIRLRGVDTDIFSFNFVL
jgi:hypothetical protein